MEGTARRFPAFHQGLLRSHLGTEMPSGGGYSVSVRFARSDAGKSALIMSTMDSGHLGAFHGGQEGPEEAFLVG